MIIKVETTKLGFANFTNLRTIKKSYFKLFSNNTEKSL